MPGREQPRWLWVPRHRGSAPATVISRTALDAVLNALPDLTLDVEELQWRPGPSHRAPALRPLRVGTGNLGWRSPCSRTVPADHA
ncbi:hypothetical protein E4K10_12970 [Streptomyces sp. T1317-0309]|nr:hypothetical protein E4K10_12970 [Streptomyces sp. T1317-0309]